jgi:hypothetical protein
VAPLGPQAPVVPGLPKLPEAGQYYASPALADLMKSVPGDELGDLFPGAEVGTIGYQALSGPHEPVAIVGYPTAQLAALPEESGAVPSPKFQAAAGASQPRRGAHCHRRRVRKTPTAPQMAITPRSCQAQGDVPGMWLKESCRLTISLRTGR